MDIVSAIEENKITINDVMRKNRESSSPLFTALGLDYDPFILGYDSTIFKICEFLIEDKKNVPYGLSTSTKNYGFFPKPFLILAGISGTGKTKWVRDQAVPGKGNVEVVPVRPDWHEPSDLLGYVSRISGEPKFVPARFLHFLVFAWRDSCAAESCLNPSSSALLGMTPFWLCLDEINLAPVEQYFADYLSVLERREWGSGRYSCPPLLAFEPGLAEATRAGLGMDAGDPLWAAFMAGGGVPLPPNLVVAGTVNMDETTHGFSRKVLDRALTVELDSVDFSRFGGTPADAPRIAVPWTKLSAVSSSSEIEMPEAHRGAALGILEKWNGIFEGTAFRIAYRTINESLLIAASLADLPEADALDWIAMAKLLPRLEGDEDRLGYDRDGDDGTYLDAVASDWSGRFGDAWEGSRAKRKLEFMTSRLRRSGFTTYWP